MDRRWTWAGVAGEKSMPQALAAATLLYESCNDTLTLIDGCPTGGLLRLRVHTQTF
jgi:hypothetical protein